MNCLKWLLTVPFLLSFLTWIVWILHDYGKAIDVSQVFKREIYYLRNTTSREGVRIPPVLVEEKPFDSPNETLQHVDAEGARDESTKPANEFSCKTAFNSTSDYHYVIEWLHWEQMTMAITSLIYLTWFTSGWDARVVEPFTKNSFFYGFNSTTHSRHPMSAIFDMQRFNDMLCAHHIPPLVNFDEFLSKGNKNLIILHLFYGEDDGKSFSAFESSKSDVLQLFQKQNSSIVSCGETKYMRDITKNFLHMTKLKRSGFRVVSCCCVNAFGGTSREIVREKCGIANAKEKHSIVVTNWRGVSSKVNFRFYSPEFAAANLPKPGKNVYPYNARVRENALAFLKLVSKGRSLLLVHIRSEKLAIREKTNPNYFNNCIDKIVELTSTILSQNKTRKFTTACITDVGQHGSRSCKENCLAKQLSILAFKKHKLNPVRYDPRKFNGLLDSTFVAAVEQEMMSMADELILVGGGSFQSQLRLRFSLNNHTDSQVHKICT